MFGHLDLSMHLWNELALALDDHHSLHLQHVTNEVASIGSQLSLASNMLSALGLPGSACEGLFAKSMEMEARRRSFFAVGVARTSNHKFVTWDEYLSAGLEIVWLSRQPST